MSSTIECWAWSTMIKWTLESRHQQIFLSEFHWIKHSGQSWPVFGVDIQANERPELFWPSFPIQWALTAKFRQLPVSYEPMTRNLALSKHRSAVTFVDFSLQCEIELEDWYRAKSKLNWTRPKSCSASESLLCRSEPETANKPLSLRSRLKWRFVDTLKRQPTWYLLILVDTSWYWVGTGLFCADAQQVLGGGIGTQAVTLLRHVKLMGLFETRAGPGNPLAISR